MSRLAASRVFMELVPPDLAGQALKAIEVLLIAGNVAAAEHFGREMGLPATSVGGLVAKLGCLNVEGYETVTWDPVARQVKLHLEHLEAQFEVSMSTSGAP